MAKNSVIADTFSCTERNTWKHALNSGAIALSKRLGYSIRAALSVLILSALFRIVGCDRVGLALNQVVWYPGMFVYVTMLISITVNASMLRYILNCVHLRVTLKRIMLAQALATFYTLILPSDVLAGIVKWSDLSAATGDKARVLSALVFATIALALPTLVVGALALTLANPFEVDGLPAVRAAIASAAIVVTALVLNERVGRSLDQVLRNWSARCPNIVQSRAESLLRAIDDFRSLRPNDHLTVFLLASLAFPLGATGMWFAFTAIGESVPVTALLWVGMILFVSRLLPITLGNLGVRESILAVAFGFYGVEPAPAVLVGSIVFSNTRLMAVVGGVYQVAVAQVWVRWRTGAE